MSNHWPMIRLGEVLRRSEDTIGPAVDVDYREITVRLWGNGVVERRRVMGAELSGRRFIAHEGQFIISRIDARNGAMGFVPPSLEGALVTSDFPLFNLNIARLEPAFLGWLCRTERFVELCQRASEGTTNRVRLQEDRFLAVQIALPPLAEQRQLAAEIDELNDQVRLARAIQQAEENEIRQMLRAVFARLTAAAPRRPMREVAPLVRRPVRVEPDSRYLEIGIRSFGKGTFHKPALSGFDLGNKKIFHIEPGDLLFTNVFAWEGAIAVARQEDAGRVGSHRYITCVPKVGVSTSAFLCYYFLTDKGLEKIGLASPGAAGRNRTLGLASLGAIDVPVPPIEDQLWFDSMQTEVSKLRDLRAESAAEVEALVPSVLSRAFDGEL